MADKAHKPCAMVRAHFSDHLDGEEVGGGTSLLVRMHLAICPPCRRMHRSLRATRDALGALRDLDVPAVPDAERDP